MHCVALSSIPIQLKDSSITIDQLSCQSDGNDYFLLISPKLQFSLHRENISSSVLAINLYVASVPGSIPNWAKKNFHQNLTRYLINWTKWNIFCWFFHKSKFSLLLYNNRVCWATICALCGTRLKRWIIEIIVQHIMPCLLNVNLSIAWICDSI